MEKDRSLYGVSHSGRAAIEHPQYAKKPSASSTLTATSSLIDRID
jgi:hypothetical protein